MSVSERDRHELYLAFEELIGADKADTMMSMLPPVGWADVTTKSDLDAAVAVLRAEFNAGMERALRSQLRVLVFAIIGAMATQTTLILTVLALLV